MTMSYLSGCLTEAITGGTVTVDADRQPGGGRQDHDPGDARLQGAPSR